MYDVLSEVTGTGVSQIVDGGIGARDHRSFQLQFVRREIMFPTNFIICSMVLGYFSGENARYFLNLARGGKGE